MTNPIRVRIQNFQSIQDVEFVIRGFTTITGKTNIGKSAIVRAIASSILNSPVVNMVRHGEKLCTVELHSDEWGFKWEKGEKGTNRYHIDGKAEVLDSVGRGQIEEVRDMGFGSIKIAENKYLSPWHADQYESVFLLNQSGPAITDFISEVSRLDVLQKGIVFLNKERHRFKEKIKFLQSDIEVLQGKRNKLSRLEEMKKIRNDLRLQRDSIIFYETKIKNAERISDEIESSKRAILLLEDIQLVKVPQAPEVDEFAKIQSMAKFATRLEQGARRIIPIRDVAKVSVPDVVEIPDLDKLRLASALLRKKEKIESFINSFKDVALPPPLGEFPKNLAVGVRLLKQMQKLQSEIDSLERRDKQLSETLQVLDEEIAKIPKCPTCERPWDHEHQGGGGGGIVSPGM